jgi:hypothetical protein
MKWSGKCGLEIEPIASDLAKIVLRSIEPRKLENLKGVGLDPENPKHRLEIIILSLFSLRTAIPAALGQDKEERLLFYVEYFLKVAYIDILKFGTIDEFETFLNERYKEYDLLDSSNAMVSEIGRCFSKNIGIANAPLIHWADMSYRNTRLMYIDYLKMINEEYELI